MNKKFLVEPAIQADTEAIADLYLTARADALPFLMRIHTDAEVRAWVAGAVMCRCRASVARQHGRIVGFAALNGDELEQLYVLPGYYRQGVGSRLLAWAKDESPGGLHLFTFQRNARARAFYEAHGFQATDFSDGSRNEELEPDMRYAWTAGP